MGISVWEINLKSQLAKTDWVKREWERARVSLSIQFILLKWIEWIMSLSAISAAWIKTIKNNSLWVDYFSTKGSKELIFSKKYKYLNVFAFISLWIDKKYKAKRGVLLDKLWRNLKSFCKTKLFMCLPRLEKINKKYM